MLLQETKKRCGQKDLNKKMHEKVRLSYLQTEDFVL